MLLGVTVCASSLTLGSQGPQRCSSARTYLVICTVAVAVLRWGLPLAIVTFLPRQEYLSMSFDLLLLLSSAVCTAHWVIYLLAGRLRRGRHQDTRDVLRQRAPMRALEVWRRGNLEQRPRGEKALDAPKGPGKNQPDSIVELFLSHLFCCFCYK